MLKSESSNRKKLLALKLAYKIITDNRNRNRYMTVTMYDEKTGTFLYYADMLDALNEIAESLDDGGADE